MAVWPQSVGRSKDCAMPLTAVVVYTRLTCLPTWLRIQESGELMLRITLPPTLHGTWLAQAGLERTEPFLQTDRA